MPIQPWAEGVHQHGSEKGLGKAFSEEVRNHAKVGEPLSPCVTSWKTREILSNLLTIGIILCSEKH